MRYGLPANFADTHLNPGALPGQQEAILSLRMQNGRYLLVQDRYENGFETHLPGHVVCDG